jgi:ATP-dependent Clp protease ATP-binding subunit ClpX
LKELDEAALIQILTEPKNALVKQYQRKFEFDNIGLKFTEDALKASPSRPTNARSAPAA